MANPNRVWKLGLLGVLCVLTLGMFRQWRTDSAAGSAETAPVLPALHVPPPEEVETHVLARGETLSGVLARADITRSDFADLLLALREHLNPRALGTGSEITVRRWRRGGGPRAVDVRANADTTVRLVKSAIGWSSEIVITPTKVDTVWVAGQIEAGRSLYTALMNDDGLDLPVGERVQLVDELSKIYGYKLDFSRDIQPGDTYRLAYEREARPDGSTRSRRVLIAEIVNQGRVYPAIYFTDRQGRGDYYDMDGRALRFGFRRSPLDYVRVTSSFSWRRYHPVLGVYRAHLGTDYGAAAGTPVKATADGTVIFAGRDGGYGNLVKIRHFGGYETRYAHLSRFAPGIRPGVAVKQEQVIGYVGSTGLATGPHLHYELRKNGQPINPRTVQIDAAPEVPHEERDRFNALVSERLALIESLVVPGPRLASRGEGIGPGTAGGL